MPTSSRTIIMISTVRECSTAVRSRSQPITVLAI